MLNKNAKLKHKAKIIGIAALSLVLVIALVIFMQPSPSFVADIPEVEFADDPVPDFSQFERVEDKKKAFFNYLRPAIDLQNEYLLNLRAYLQGLRAKLIAGESLSESQQEELEWLIEEYRVDTDQDEIKIFDALLRKIDIIPAELVLIQSANESAWGTSRFAQEGYNFFGIWCFVEGCGFVPKRRNSGAVHEVAKFDDLSSAMYSYMRNINRHPAYRELRSIRSKLRTNQQEITAMKLAEGLHKYSERGEEYVEELQLMIQINRDLI
uniref:glucosaminidase domain-containing protein n=1 Tax=Ningiella ruwaisensis TaxID=2364274 RepID=UPI0010A039D0|nr:glucosaminidase domain-containing protein [Ningiella ruwaisensis]